MKNQQTLPKYTITPKPQLATIEIALRGVLAVATSYQPAAEELKKLLEQNEWKAVVVNLQEVEAISSEGISFLLRLFSTARLHRASLRLLNPQPQVEKILKLTGMDRVFEIARE